MFIWSKRHWARQTQKINLEVEWADHLERGLQYLSSNSVEAVLLDLRLPDSEGLATLQRVLTYASSVPVIVMTEQADEVVAMQAVQAGAQDYLIKGQVDGQLLALSIQYAIQRKQVESALRESQQLFESAFHYAAIGMALVAPNGHWLQVNQSLCTLLGYTEQELLAKTLQAITHPEDRQTVLEHVRQILAGEIQTFQMEKRYIHKRGRVIWVLLGVSLMRDEHDQPLYFIAQMQDITERKQAEEKFRGLLESAPDGVVVVDGKGIIQLVNSQLEKLFSCDRRELLGKSIEVLIPARFRNNHVDFRTEFFDAPRSRLMESGIDLYAVRPDGTEFPVEISLSPLQTDEGTLVSAAIRDITERKLAEFKIGNLNAALRENEKRYRSLFENMISGYAFCQMLFDQNNKPEDFIYIAVNPAFEKLTGLRDVVGKKVSDVIPGIQELNPELLEAYGRVALTGKPEKLEITHRIVGDLVFHFSV